MAARGLGLVAAGRHGQGTQWDPVQKNYLTTVGASKFLPTAFSLTQATLELTRGQDVVALERTSNALIVSLADTLNGAGKYEYEIDFPPAQPPPHKLPAALWPA